MGNKLRKIRRASLALMVIVVVALVAARAFAPWGLKRYVFPTLAKKTGFVAIEANAREISFRALDLSSIFLGGRQPAIFIDSARLNFSPLKAARREVDDISLSGIDIFLEYRDGRLRFRGGDAVFRPPTGAATTVGAKTAGPDFFFKGLVIRGATAHIDFGESVLRVPFTVNLIPGRRGSGLYYFIVDACPRDQRISISGSVDPERGSGEVKLEVRAFDLGKFTELVRVFVGTSGGAAGVVRADLSARMDNFQLTECALKGQLTDFAAAMAGVSLRQPRDDDGKARPIVFAAGYSAAARAWEGTWSGCGLTAPIKTYLADIRCVADKTETGSPRVRLTAGLGPIFFPSATGAKLTVAACPSHIDVEAEKRDDAIVFKAALERRAPTSFDASVNRFLCGDARVELTRGTFRGGVLKADFSGRVSAARGLVGPVAFEFPKAALEGSFSVDSAAFDARVAVPPTRGGVTVKTTSGELSAPKNDMDLALSLKVPFVAPTERAEGTFRGAIVAETLSAKKGGNVLTVRQARTETRGRFGLKGINDISGEMTWNAADARFDNAAVSFDMPTARGRMEVTRAADGLPRGCCRAEISLRDLRTKTPTPVVIASGEWRGLCRSVRIVDGKPVCVGESALGLSGIEWGASRVDSARAETTLAWPMSPDTATSGQWGLTALKINALSLGDLKGRLTQRDLGLAMTLDQNMLYPDLRVKAGVEFGFDHSTGGARGKCDFSAEKTMPDSSWALMPWRPEGGGPIFRGGLSLSANADWVPGRVKSRGAVRVRDGSVSDAKTGLSLEKIDTAITLTDLFAPTTAPEQAISIARAAFGKFEITDVLMSGRIGSMTSLFLEKAAFSWIGGKVYSRAARFRPGSRELEIVLDCSRLQLAGLINQFCDWDAFGAGELTGRVPLRITPVGFYFDNGYLYTTPGIGGVLKVRAAPGLADAFPLGSPAQVQADIAVEALRDFQYDWARVSLESDRDSFLGVKLNLYGKPAAPLPFAYDPLQGTFARTDGQSNTRFQGIALDININPFSFNEMVRYDPNVRRVMNKLFNAMGGGQ